MGSEKPLSTSMLEESQAKVKVIRQPLQVSCSSFAMRWHVSRVKTEDSQRNAQLASIDITNLNVLTLGASAQLYGAAQVAALEADRSSRH